MARPGVMMYFDIRGGLAHLSTESRCAVYDAVLNYGEFGEVPEFDDPMARMAWDWLRPRLDKDREAYEKRKAKRAKPDVTEEIRSNQIVPENSVGEQNTTEQNTTDKNITEHNTTDKNTAQKNTTEHSTSYLNPAREGTSVVFCPPGYQEVAAYCEKNKLQVNPRQFMDYYTANGWKIGQNPIVDWRAALRSWENKKKEIPYGSQAYTKTKFPGLDKIGTRL